MPKRSILIILCLVFSVSGAFASQHDHSSSRTGSSTHSRSSSKTTSTSKTDHVRSYTRKDGTVVKAYNRRPPGSKQYDSTNSVATVRSSAPTGVMRDSNGRIKRSAEEKREFERQTGYAQGRPGYVVDHIKPLACGGSDTSDNMQWQTIAEAKAKDKTERKDCQ
jgi:hypothetical protein